MAILLLSFGVTAACFLVGGLAGHYAYELLKQMLTH